MGYLAERYCELMLADTTHQLNCGEYIPWRVMLVDDSGLGKSFFYALLPIADYCRAVYAMKNVFPYTDNLHTIVVNRSLAQLNALQTAYPQADSICLRILRFNGKNALCAYWNTHVDLDDIAEWVHCNFCRRWTFPVRKLLERGRLHMCSLFHSKRYVHTANAHSTVSCTVIKLGTIFIFPFTAVAVWPEKNED